MHTLRKVFADRPRRAALTALPLVGSLTLAGAAEAQQPQPPFGPQPIPGQPAQPPGAFGPEQPPAQPGPFGPQPGQPGSFGPQPGQPGSFGPQPGQPGPFGPQPGFPGDAPPQFGPQPGQPPPDASFSFGAQASAGDQGLQASATAPTSTAWDEEERALSLIAQPNLWGSTGLLRTSYAGSGAPGTFRVSFLLDWFSTSGFLCDPADVDARGSARITCGPTRKRTRRATSARSSRSTRRPCPSSRGTRPSARTRTRTTRAARSSCRCSATRRSA